MNESFKFRCVHAAREILDKYISSGRNIEIIRAVKDIDRYDVWLAVFEKEIEASKEIRIKELYNTCFRCDKRDNPECREISIQILVGILVSCAEQKEWSIKVDEAIEIIMDVFDDDVLKELSEEAQVHLDRRIKIIKPYFNPEDCVSNEWVEQARFVVERIHDHINDKK